MVTEISRRKTIGQTSGGTYQRKGVEKLETEGWIIVPVPLSWVKLRRRGYNQAELIARHLFNSRNNLLWGGGLLSKIRETKSQVEVKDREERLANIVGSFKAEKPELVKGKKIILIDDVYHPAPL